MSGNAEDALRALARAGRRMRQLQKTYFDLRRRRDPDADSTLFASKRAEAEFDALVAEALDFRTPSMFDAAGGAGQ
jgi:hypothetical protein